MEAVVLNAKVRTDDQIVKKMRATGFLPAELYGQGKENLHLFVSANEFERVFRKAGESSIIALEIEGQGKRNVLIHDVQAHYLKSIPNHVDFLEINMAEKLTANIPLEFIGESVAVKASGGTLVKVMSEVEVECLPSDLPHNLEVNIESLKTFDDVIAAKDILLPKGVTLTMEDMDEVVAKVQPPRDVEAELAEPIEEDVSKVEGVAEDKPAESAPESGDAGKK
jgi:large subunit ribosomal protein L25